MFRRIASLVAILLLLATAAPVMACVTNQQRTQSENSCCESMHGQCGEMAKTGCCRVEFQDQQPLVAAHVTALPLHWLVVVLLPSSHATPQFNLDARWLAPEEPSPPPPRSTKSIALRV